MRSKTALTRIQHYVLLAAVVLVLAVPNSKSNAQAPEQYKVGQGDQLRVIVFGEEDLSGEFFVDEQGSVSLPLIGEVMVGERTIRQVEEDIETKLKDGYLLQPQVNVEVLNFRPFYILGEVNQPGAYPFVSGMTVLKAVSLAGGYTYRAKSSSMLVTRGQSNEESPITEESFVLPGDIIRVPERFF